MGKKQYVRSEVYELAQQQARRDFNRRDHPQPPPQPEDYRQHIKIWYGLAVATTIASASRTGVSYFHAVQSDGFPALLGYLQSIMGVVATEITLFFGLYFLIKLLYKQVRDPGIVRWILVGSLVVTTLFVFVLALLGNLAATTLGITDVIAYGIGIAPVLTGAMAGVVVAGFEAEQTYQYQYIEDWKRQAAQDREKRFDEFFLTNRRDYIRMAERDLEAENPPAETPPTLHEARQIVRQAPLPPKPDNPAYRWMEENYEDVMNNGSLLISRAMQQALGDDATVSRPTIDKYKEIMKTWNGH